jgi:beta propeller repeat protein
MRKFYPTRIKERIRECTFFTVFGFVVLVLAGAVRETKADFVEQPICTHSADQLEPRISAESTDANEIIVVWTDCRDGDYPTSRIYMWDSNGIKPVSKNASKYRQRYPDISKSYVVWEDSGAIFFKNLKDPNSEQLISAGTSPAISGNTVVWREKRVIVNPVDGIFMWDPVNGKRVVYTNPDPNTNLSSLDISGNKVVWQEDVNGNSDIYMWDPVNGRRIICNHPAYQMHPAISKDIVVWEDGRGEHRNLDIYMWDPINGEKAVCTNRAHQRNPAVFVDIIVKIVWEDYRNDIGHIPEMPGNPDIYMWDPVNGERAVCTNPVRPPYFLPPQSCPDISGNYIVWQDSRKNLWDEDIYMAKIPEKTIKADFDNDGIVNFNDFAKFAEQWLATEQWFTDE